MSNHDYKHKYDWNLLDGEIKEWEDTAKQVIADIKDRHAFGLQKYGKSLNVKTNEDMLQHLYEEILDSAIYIKTLLEQRKVEKYTPGPLGTHNGGCC